MADGTHIQWTDATWNPVTGCSVVSPGCTNCYAMRLAGTRLQHHPSRKGLTRDSKAGPVWTGEVRFNEDWLDQPLRWRRPRRIFVCAHGDIFAEGVPDEWIDRVFAVMALAPQHTFQVLTKRAQRMLDYSSDPTTPFRVARAMDSLHARLATESAAAEQIRPLDAWPGCHVSDRGRVFTDRGSATCVHCGGPVERTARALYCSKKCRQNAQYRLRVGKPMLHPPTLAEMSPDVGEDGHRRVMLYREGETHRQLVHRLVLTTFVGPAPSPDAQGRHRDGHPSNNALSNLSWGDQVSNWGDRKRHGHHRSYAKLSEADVAKIRSRGASGETAAAIAADFPISDTQVRNILAGKQWSIEPTIEWPLRNCWKGVSAEDQTRADERIPLLLDTPAAKRFVSLEPLLGPIAIGPWLHDSDCDLQEHGAAGICTCCEPREVRIDWVIVGGESGPGARPMHPQWARDLRDQCQAAGVAFHFKQFGEFKEGSDFASDAIVVLADGRQCDGSSESLRALDRDTPVMRQNPTFMRRVGKKAAGRSLGGREWNEFPA